MYKLTGIGNAIVDIILEVSEEDFAKLGYQKGSMNLVSASEQAQLLDKFRSENSPMVSGGAVANSVVVAKQRGLDVAYIGSFSDDLYGKFFKSDMESHGVAVSASEQSGLISGTSVILVTPDGERTMQTALGVSEKIKANQVDENIIKNSEYILVEGYLLASNDAYGAVEKVIKLAKEFNKEIIVALSAPFIIEVFRERLDKLMEASSICFCNLDEGRAYTGLESPLEIAKKISDYIPHVILTLNKEGSIVVNSGGVHEIPTTEVKAIDSTGAGDAFCGAYLAEFIKGKSEEDAARVASKIASSAVQQFGARLPDEKVV